MNSNITYGHVLLTLLEHQLAITACIALVRTSEWTASTPELVMQAKHECELVWEAMQAELHQLFAELLDAPSLTAHHGPAAASGNNTNVARKTETSCLPRCVANTLFAFSVSSPQGLCRTNVEQAMCARMLSELSSGGMVECVVMYVDYLQRL